MLKKDNDPAKALQAKLAAKQNAVSANDTSTIPKSTSWAEYLNKNRSAIENVLPSAMRKSGGTERLMRLALTTIRRNPKLLNCSMPSLMGSLLECGALGLEPNTPLAQAYIVPYNNKSSGTVDAQLIVGYQGLIDLAYRSSAVETIYALAVRAKDVFKVSFGTQECLHHDIPKGNFKDRGVIVAFYAYAKLKGGAYRFTEPWPIDRMEDHAKRFSPSANSSSSPWQTDFESMGRKTMVRQLVNWLPRSTEIMRAIESDGGIGKDASNFDFQIHNPDDGGFVQPEETSYSEV